MVPGRHPHPRLRQQQMHLLRFKEPWPILSLCPGRHPQKIVIKSGAATLCRPALSWLACPKEDLNETILMARRHLDHSGPSIFQNRLVPVRLRIHQRQRFLASAADLRAVVAKPRPLAVEKRIILLLWFYIQHPLPKLVSIHVR